jgi:hypothetical protein
MQTTADWIQGDEANHSNLSSLACIFIKSHKKKPQSSNIFQNPSSEGNHLLLKSALLQYIGLHAMAKKNHKRKEEWKNTKFLKGEHFLNEIQCRPEKRE